MGFRTVAIGRGEDKVSLARKLGADEYVDAAKGSAGAALQKLGGAKVILATAPSGAAVADVMPGLGISGQLLLLAAVAEPLPVNTVPMLLQRQSLRAWPSGHAKDSEETLRFAAQTGIRPMIETFPLAKAQDAFDRMATGKARFRAVVTMD
jgi:D-arabinose 1-dehydrogenase-like Zn-dependent alcohol dehydrogenase